MKFLKYVLPVFALNCCAETEKSFNYTDLLAPVESVNENREELREFSDKFQEAQKSGKKFISLCLICDQKLEALNLLIQEGFVLEKQKEEAAKILIIDSMKPLDAQIITDLVLQGYALNHWNSLHISEAPLN